MMELIDKSIKYGGINKRCGDLFGNKSFITKYIRKIISNVNGLENPYTLHKPYINTIITDLLNSKLSNEDYIHKNKQQHQRNNSISKLLTSKESINDIIIFIIGGVTYEEICSINNLSKLHNIKITIISTKIHNSSSFLSFLRNINMNSI